MPESTHLFRIERGLDDRWRIEARDTDAYESCDAALVEAQADEQKLIQRGRQQVLRELGCAIGMDDYVPEHDTNYWSVENVRQHIMWLEERAAKSGPP